MAAPTRIRLQLYGKILLFQNYNKTEFTKQLFKRQFHRCSICRTTEDGDNPSLVEVTRRPVTKVAKISKAMTAYLARAKAHDNVMKHDIAEYEIGKRHLANIMGKDPESFDQNDIDEAIRYLLPSGLFDKKARPMLKHPEEVHLKRKQAQFGVDGRPFHYQFYTGRPNYYEEMHNLSLKIEELNKAEDEQYKNSPVPLEKRLHLTGSEWLPYPALKDRLIENISEIDYHSFVKLIERVAEHPMAFTIEDYLMTFRRKLTIMSSSDETLMPQIDTDGREFIIAQGSRKTSKATVKLWIRGTGQLTINEKDLVSYQPQCIAREAIMFPIQFIEKLGEIDIEATVSGGGPTGQAGAIRLGISRALSAFVDKDMKESMRQAGLLTRDPRRHERKKPGQMRARRKYTWKKR